MRKKKVFYQNQKINQILKNQKKFQKKYQRYPKNKLLSKKLNELLHILPNLAQDDVPIGKDENSNKLIKKFGKIKKFSFKPKSHTELGLKSNEIDFDTASKLSGSRFVVLKNKIALLERALINFMLDTHTKILIILKYHLH